MSRHLRWVVALGLTASALGASPAEAQEEQEEAGAARAQEEAQEAPRVRFISSPTSEAQRRLARFLDEGGYRLWTRDTLLARGEAVGQGVLVLQSAARIAGRVDGDVVVVDGDLFLRPGSRVTGDVVVIGGGFYRSGMAEVDGDLLYRPSELVRAIPEEGGWAIFRVRDDPRALDLGPLYGLRFPHFQRVDGWVVRWGGIARGITLPWRPELALELRYRFGREAFDFSARQTWNPVETFRFGVEGGRATRTNDAWIRPTFENTISFLLAGNDYRDYYRADRIGAFVEGEVADGWRWSLAGRWEDARSLEAEDRATLFGDGPRPNPPVDGGDAWSLLPTLTFERRAGAARTGFRLALEGASAEVAGEVSFLLAETRALLQRGLPWGHRVEAFAIGRGELAGSLPPRRWSGLGGVGTLPTLPILALRGPRMAFGELTYAIPIPSLEVPAIGPTHVFGRGALGSAWADGAEPRFEQALTAGVRFLFVEAAVAVDPRGGDPEIYLRSRVPRRVRDR